MNIRRVLTRIEFHSKKIILKKIALFNHRLYMKHYIKLLKSMGMNISDSVKYIGPNTSFDDFDKIILGSNVVISDMCRFMTHDYSYTTALISIGKAPMKDIALIRGIEVGNNVFIGARTIIMPGTTIGDNVIVGAGSVVRGKIESDSIIIGNPAIKIRSTKDQARKWLNKYGVNNLRRDL